MTLVAIALVLAGVLAWRFVSALPWSVHVDATQASSSRLVLLGVHVRKNGQPLLDARRIEIDYSLRDLFPGSKHRYGIRAIDVDGATFTLTREKDGSYSIPLSGGAGAPPSGPQRANTVPIALRLRVRDSAIALRAPWSLDPVAHAVDVRKIDVDATIDSSARSQYRLTGAFMQPFEQPFFATGTIDVPREYAMNRFIAHEIPARGITDFFVNTPAFGIISGHARDVNFLLYSVGDSGMHMGGSVDVRDASIHVVGLAVPVTHLNSSVQLVDDQVFFPHVTGLAGAMPIEATGAVFNFAQPQFRVGISAHANLRVLRQLFKFMGDQDVAGPADVGVSVEGSVDSPAILASVKAANVEYRGIPFDTLDARIGYSNDVVSFLPIRASSEGARVTIRGALELGEHTRTRAAVHVDANADTLPYAGEFLGKEPLEMDALLDGNDSNFYGYGSLISRRGVDRVAVLMHAAPDGVLDVAPLEMRAGAGTLAGGYHLDRHTDRSAFWLDIRNVALHAPALRSFLHATLPDIPPLEGQIDRFAIVAGGRSGNQALIAGDADAHALTIGGVGFSRLHAAFAGTLQNAAIDPVTAAGPWGTFAGTGSLSLGGAIAARGHYAGTLEGLEPFLGGIPASGAIDGTAAIALHDGAITIQADDIALAHAQIRGVAISRATGTMAVRGGDFHIYNARATVAGGSVVAAGSYQRGIGLVATHVDAAGLRGLGLPLDGGRVDASGELRSGAPLPAFDGGVALANGRVQDYSVDGSGLVALHGDGAQLDRVVGGFNGIYAIAHGSLAGLTSGEPSYDVRAVVPAGDLGGAVSALDLPAHYTTGTFNANLSIAGVGLAPEVRGPFGIPAGSINGMYFTDGRAQIAADPNGASATGGTVSVGTTTLQFNATENRAISAIQLNAAHTNLADFDDFFDTGDTLAGNGSMRFDLISQGHRLSTNGSIDIAGLRYRSLPIGDTVASWASAHNEIGGVLDVAGPEGALHSRGVIDIAGGSDFLRVLRDSRYDLTAQMTQADLSTWIAALGYPQVVVTGRVDGTASVSGRFPRLQMRANADLKNGTIWRLPIDSAQVAVSSNTRRLTIDAAELTAPGLYARASGSLGFSPGDKLALQLYASSSDVPELVYELFRYQVPVKGDFESTLSVGGTLAKPAFEAAFDVSNAVLYGIDVPLAFGQIELRGNDVVLHNAGIQLAKGTMTVEGTLPLRLRPLGLGAANAPISFDASVNAVDPGAFDTFLGNGTKLGGTIDGTVGVAGTIGAPTITGKFTIAKGSYVSDFDRTPITNVNAAVAFNRTSGTLQNFTARLGAGTFNASGSATFAGSIFDIKAIAHGAQIDSPQFGSGSIDANVHFSHAAGAPNAMLAGSATLQSATIPFAAFIAATQNGAAVPPLPLGFDFTFAASKNVRVRGSGYGAGLDIGATGKVHLAGTLSAPSLDGRFSATSGTLTYFDRAFRVQQAHVDFDPADGVIPTLYATGITRISNPDPNTLLNPYGSTDITVTVSGPITGLRIAFTSSPPGYSNEQILAMIAPFGGLVNGVSYAPSFNQVAGVTAPATAPIPTAQTLGGTSAGLTVGQEAFNILNAQFSAGLLSPFEGALSQGLGLQNVALTLDYYGNVGISATRLLGKTVNAIYSQTFGIPQRTSFGFQLIGERSTTAQVTFFYTTGPQLLYQITSPTANRAMIGEPLTGQSGFAFTLQRHFW